MATQKLALVHDTRSTPGDVNTCAGEALHVKGASDGLGTTDGVADAARGDNDVELVPASNPVLAHAEMQRAATTRATRRCLPSWMMGCPRSRSSGVAPGARRLPPPLR